MTREDGNKLSDDSALWNSLNEDDFFKDIVDGDGAVDGEGVDGFADVWDALDRNQDLLPPSLGAGIEENAGKSSGPDVIFDSKVNGDVTRDSARPGVDSAAGDLPHAPVIPESRKERHSTDDGSNDAGSGGGSGGGRSVVGATADSAIDVAFDLATATAQVRAVPESLRALHRQRAEPGDAPFEDSDISAAPFDPEDIARRLGAVLDDVSAELDHGSLTQLFLPRLSGDGGVFLCASRELTRTNTVHGEKFRRYHEASRSFVFGISPTSSEVMLGLPGRCFLLRRPEWTPSVCCYRPMEYPRLACAIECQVHSTMALPLFASEPELKGAAGGSLRSPLSVMEVLLDHQTTDLGSVFKCISSCLARHGFFTLGHDQIGPERVMRAALESTLARVCDSNAVALQHMCHTLGFPFAQCWIPCENGNLITAGAPHCVNDTMALPYRQVSEQVALQPERGGPVGRAHEKGRMIWVDDVQQGSQVDWPLQHATALLGLRGSCACNLLLTAVGGGPKIDAVLEVFLPSNLSSAEQQQRSVDALWNYLKTTTQLELSDAPVNTVGPSGTDASGTGAARVGAGGSRARENEGGFGGARPPWGVTLEVLQQHFNKHLKEAAKDLGVGSTTLKRICRHFGIARWPRRSLKSKQGKLHNALKTLTAEGNFVPGSQWPPGIASPSGVVNVGGYDAGGSMHGGSMMDASQRGGSMMTGSMMSVGQAEDVDPYAAGGSVHGPPRGVGAFPQGLPGGFPVAVAGSVHGSDGSGASAHTMARGLSANGAAAFQGDGSGRGGMHFFPGAGSSQHGSQHGSSRGASAHGGASLAGFKRQMGDTAGPWGGVGATFDFPSMPDSKRGASWHGSDAARDAMTGGRVTSRMEKTSHGNFAFAQMMQVSGGGMQGMGPNAHTLANAGSPYSHSPDPTLRRVPSGSFSAGGGTNSGGFGGGFIADHPSSDRAAAANHPSSSSGDGDTFTFKITCGEETVRLTLTPDMRFHDLVARIRSSVAVDESRLRLRYQDDDGDFCALAGDADLDECREVAKSTGSMRVQASVM